MRRSIFIIGCGAVGASMGKALCDAGAEIAGVHDLDYERARASAKRLDTEAFSGVLPDALMRAKIVLTTVPDCEIEQTAARAATSKRCAREQLWVHCSGRLGAEALSPLGDGVRGYGAMHPALVFPPGRISPIPPGTCFSLDGDLQTRDMISELVETLDGMIVEIPPERRAAYHAAMVMVSNYAVTLLSEARGVLTASGVDPTQAAPLLLNLMNSALRAVQERGIDEALSGPIRRGDAEAVREHLIALTPDAQARELYVALGKATARMVSRMPDVEDDNLVEILRILR